MWVICLMISALFPCILVSIGEEMWRMDGGVDKSV